MTRDVENHGAIVFCRLPDECAPMAHMILSLDTEDGPIDGLPFGPARVLRATPVTAEEVADGNPAEHWSVTAARTALDRRRSRPLKSLTRRG